MTGTDPWVSRARPSFLYVIYVIILYAVPLGIVAAVRPHLADAMIGAMTAYLRAIPDSLWTLFGTGYLGYTAARQWGKAKGVE
jgi:ABC-type dipeptide/oligopeptide/nickel transport system permease component